MKYVLVLAVLLALGASIAQAGEKVTICHATGSQTNPFVEITIARQAWENGHSPHAVHVDDFLVTEGQTCVPNVPTATLTPTATPIITSTDIPTSTPTQTSRPLPIPTTTSEAITPVASSIVVPPEFPTALPTSGGVPPQ